MGVQAVQLSWMTATAYHGIYILLVYLCLLLWLGVQFGLFVFYLPKDLNPSLTQCIALASAWVFFEWSRLFVFCGFPFNMLGYSLTAFPLSAQLAAVFGVFGLSFLVILINLFALLYLRSRSLRDLGRYFGILAIVYGLGWMHLGYHQRKIENHHATYEVALVQTGLRPEQKIPLRGQEHEFIHPVDQWINILWELKKSYKKHWDLIVLPEAAVPYGANYAVYSLEEVKGALRGIWGVDYERYLPQTEQGISQVSNLFWVQAIANYYFSEVVIGLDDYDLLVDQGYNAAFHVMPGVDSTKRYEKCILVPLAEYLPIKWLQSLVYKYGITNFATHGKHSKIFSHRVPVAISICYEECFGNFMRQGRKNGAQLFVNVTNDGWYLPSKLPEQHLYHARLRSIENGVPLVRACNSGVTAIVDSVGLIRASLPKESEVDIYRGVLSGTVSLYHYPTLYTMYGDSLILIICGLSLAAWVIMHCYLRKSLTLSR